MSLLDIGQLRRPIVWGPILFLVAAVLVWLLPVAPFGAIGTAGNSGVVSVPATGGAPAVAEPAPVAAGTATPAPAPRPAGVDSTSIEVVHSAPTVAGAASQPADATQPARPLQLRAASSSWVEVRDARGAILLSRTLQPGETVGVAGQLPFQAIVGNAAETTATVNGQPFDITVHTRENIARFEVR